MKFELTKIKKEKEVTLIIYDKKFINLLPEEYKEKSKKRSFMLFVVMIIAFISVGSVMYYINLSKEIEMITAEREKIEEQIELLSQSKEKQAVLVYLNQLIEFKQTLLKNAEDKYISMKLLTSKIENHVPESIEFYNVDIVASDEINIDAHCNDEKSIAYMINELKKVDIFEDVKVGSIAKMDFFNSVTTVYEEKYVFNVVIELRGVVNEE